MVVINYLDKNGNLKKQEKPIIYDELENKFFKINIIKDADKDINKINNFNMLKPKLDMFRNSIIKKSEIVKTTIDNKKNKDIKTIVDNKSNIKKTNENNTKKDSKNNPANTNKKNTDSDKPKVKKPKLSHDEIKKINTLCDRWESVMTQLKLYNRLHETFTLYNIKVTKYGYEAEVLIPDGFSYKNLDTNVDVIQNNLECSILLKTYKNKRYAEIQIIELEDCNKIPFKPHNVKPYEMFFGVNPAGEPIVFDINISPHVLLGGQTRSGKNGGLDHCMASWIYSCNENEIELYLIQGAKGDLAKYEDCKQVKQFIYGSELHDIDSMLKQILSVMDKRKKLFKKMNKSFTGENLFDYNRNNPNKQLPYVYVVFDEFLSLVPNKDDEKDIKKAKNKLMGKIEKIAQFGGSYGVTYIVSHQKPEKELCPTFIKNSANVRISFGFRDMICSEIVLGTGRFEAVGLPPRKAFYTCNDGNEGYLYTTDLSGRIKQYVMPSMIEKEDLDEDDEDVDIDDEKDNNKAISSDTVDSLEKKVEMLIEMSKSEISPPIIVNEIKTIDNKKQDELLKEERKYKRDSSIPNTKKIIPPNDSKFNFDKVSPKTQSELLMESISNIEGFVPYVQPKRKD